MRGVEGRGAVWNLSEKSSVLVGGGFPNHPNGFAIERKPNEISGVNDPEFCGEEFNFNTPKRAQYNGRSPWG